MTKIVTLCSVGYGVPALDSRGNPIRSKIKWNGRETEIVEQNQVRVDAGKTVDVPADVAKEMVEKGYARPFDGALDDVIGEIDPTVNTDPAKSEGDPNPLD